jgi:hypothetical protein
LNNDFLDMLSALCAEAAEFLVVGAYAMAAHGLPRATGDIDLWIRPRADNASRVIAALRRFGAPLHDLTAADLSTPDTVFQIGIAPRRIDLMTSIDGVEFEAAWQDRVPVRVGSLEVWTLSRQHLLQNKRATGRARDLGDAAWLEERGG